MAYIRAYLETCEGYGWEGGPEFNTRIVTMANGFERRNGDWAEARRKFSLPFLNISRERYVPIRNMFYVAKGMLHCFLYRDPLDHQADDEIIGIGDGVTQLYQLSKITVVDSFIYQRNVYAIPDSENIQVTIDGNPEVDFYLDRDRGTIEFDVPPTMSSVIRWSGLFDTWVRFNQDYLPFTIDNINAHNGQVELLEMPPPEQESGS